MTPRGLLLAAGALGVVSLGLPWAAVGSVVDVPLQLPLASPLDTPFGAYDGLEVVGAGVDVEGTALVHGAAHQVRVLGAAAAVGLWLALRRGSRRLAWAALAVGVVALPVDLADDGTWPGRAAYAGALAAAALALLSWRWAVPGEPADDGSARPAAEDPARPAGNAAPPAASSG